MVEGNETPRPRRARPPRDAETDSPPVVGRRARWPQNWAHEDPAPVSRRAWSPPPEDEATGIQPVIGPARQVHITPADVADEETPEIGRRARPAATAGAAQPTPAMAPPDPAVSSTSAPTAPTPEITTDEKPQDALPHTTTSSTTPQSTPVTGYVPVTLEAPPAIRPAQEPSTASGPGSHPQMPTLQPPSYTNQPAPAPQQKVADRTTPATQPTTTAKAADPALTEPKPARARAGHLQEWDAPTESRFDPRTRRSLLLAAVAGVIVVAIAVGYAILGGRDLQAQPPGSDSPTVTRPPEPFPSERMMLSPDGAALIDDQAWTVSRTDEGIANDAPRPTCVRLTVDGQPVPRATMLRTLTSDGDDGASALHVMDTYASAEEAAQVFASRSTQLGGCDREPTLITGGYAISDLGDESVGITTVVEDDDNIRHTIVMSRTGTAVNIIDIARPESPASVEGTVDAMATVIDSQCNAAIGLCTLSQSVRNAPPPPAGGDPGFLTPADIPRITSGAGAWSANPATSDVNVVGSQCEAVSSWGSVPDAEDSRMATYLLLDDPASPAAFGMDQVVVTFDSADAAEKFVDTVSTSLEGCADRMLTASVSNPVEVEGYGAGGSTVTGAAYRVTQQSGSGELEYRVGIVSANTKVAYVVLPVDGDFDFTDEQWESVVQRAGERASQVR